MPLPATTAPPPTGAALPLAEAVQIAEQRSQRVAAARMQAQAAREMAVAAAPRPDPVLKFGVDELPIDGVDRFNSSTTLRKVGLMQELTRADKREARAARAQREADAAWGARRLAASEVQRDTAIAWLERSFQQDVRDALLAQAREAELQVQAAQTLYGTGKAMQADVFAARAQVEQLLDRVAQTERAIGVATAQLARWIGEHAQRPGDLRPALTPPAWTANPDLRTHLTQHAAIDSATRQEAVARADAQVARTEQRPDWSVEVMVGQRGPSYTNMLSVTLSLPLQWNAAQRQDREVAAREALAARSAAETEDLLRAHEADVRAMLSEWRNSEQRLQRYDASLLPLARQRSAASLTAYRAGSGNLMAVLEARRAEIETRIERLRIESDIARLWAQLAFLDIQADPPPTPHPEPAAASGHGAAAPHESRRSAP